MSKETKTENLYRVVVAETHFFETEIEADSKEGAENIVAYHDDLELELLDATDREIVDIEKISRPKPCTTCGDVKGYDYCDCTRCVNCGHQHTFEQAREAKLWSIDEPKYCLIGECKKRHDKVDYILPGEE